MIDIKHNIKYQRKKIRLKYLHYDKKANSLQHSAISKSVVGGNLNVFVKSFIFARMQSQVIKK